MRHGPRCLGILLLLALAPLARADGSEQRDFAIFIDNKEAGTSRVTVVQQGDGTTYMTATVSVNFKRLIGSLALTIDAQEWWKDGKLVGMKSSSVENGKKTEITAALDAGTLRVRTGGQERAINPEAWTSSYWKLADAKYHDKAVPVLDVDTGKEFAGQLKFVAQQQLKVGGDLQNCYHFRVTGGPAPIDLWYDVHHRLVRQEFTESGHRTIVMLTSVRR